MQTVRGSLVPGRTGYRQDKSAELHPALRAPKGDLLSSGTWGSRHTVKVVAEYEHRQQASPSGRDPHTGNCCDVIVDTSNRWWRGTI
jgi:hypothetical protein